MQPIEAHAGAAPAPDEAGRRVVPPGNRLDATNAAQFKDDTLRRVTPGERVVVDLSGLRFLDSSGIGALVGIARHLGSTGELRLVAPDPEVRAVLAITRIDQLLPIDDNPTPTAR